MARARAWAAGAAPTEIVIDLDGTLLDAHSDKQDAAATYKRGFGFYPIVGYLDETGEALAGVLRSGNAGSNNSADHLETLDRSLAQLTVAPSEVEMLVRSFLRLKTQLAKLDPLVLDELGYVPASKVGAEQLFDVISTAYERTSLIVTTNLPFRIMDEVLGSERLTGAALDRLTRRCRIIETKGESYRLHDAKTRTRSTKHQTGVAIPRTPAKD